MTNPILASFNILNIILTESNFKRENSIDFTRTQVPNIDVKSAYTILPDGNSMYCQVELSYFATYEGSTERIIDSRIVMGANFNKTGDSTLSFEDFGKVNGPAIIFPFIREHLSTLSLKASINPIILPPVNFHALSKQS